MQGVISSYRRSRHVTSNNQVIVHVEGVDSKEAAEKLVGKKVTWNTGKRALTGEVSAAHGNKGAVRVRFATGMPGQCLGQTVSLQ
ncbi:50S ribosomal protein L35ae [Candidatus Woesearchaeota archaeon]|nr:MAG: 50S ribosomal protein L35ae [Candidatus Woesearchaeota archaeon]